MNSGKPTAADAKFQTLELLLVFLVLFVPMQVFLPAAELTIFTARDLDRARLLAAGQLILFGPEASGGSQLPGSFFYFLLAIPLKLGLGWKAVWQMQFAMTAAGFSLMWLFLRSRFGIFPAYYALFCAAFFNYKVLFFANNASFLPLFVVASLVSLCAAFDERSGRRALAWVVFCLSCGLGMQLHMAFSLILLSGLAVQLLSARFGLRPLPWKTFATGLLAFLVLMLPYGVWAVSVHLSRPIGQPVLPFTGGATADLMGILKYWIEAKSGLPAQALLSRSMTLLPVEAIVPLLLLYFGTAPVKAGHTPAPNADQRFAGTCVKVLAVPAALTFVLYAMSFALSPSRYALIPRLCLDLLACAALASRADRIRPRLFYPSLILGLFAFTLAWNVFLRSSGPFSPGLLHILFPAAAGLALAALVRRTGGAGALFSMAPVLPLFLALAVDARLSNRSKNGIPDSRDYETMSRVILAQTGWTYADARLRIFYVNVHDTATPSWIYRAAETEGAGADPAGSGLDRVDGYFAPFLGEKVAGWKDGRAAAQWLLRQDIPGTLKDGLSSGGILLGTPAACGGVVLVPYKIAHTEKFPPYFHNSSEGYSLTGPVPALPPAPGAKTFRLTFNDCPGRGKVCEIPVDIRLRPGGGGRWSAHVVISGEPLSQVSDGVNMQWNQRLKRLYFSAVCGGTERRVALADALGMHRDRSLTTNRSLLAPYERNFHFDCRGRLEKITVGYEGAAAYSMGRVIDGLPGQELSVKVGADAPAPR